MSKPVGKRTPSRSSATPTVASTTTRTNTRKPAAKKEASAAEPAAPPRAAKNILSAGIKALTNAHEEAVARQSRVFESLLGLGQKRDVDTAMHEQPSVAATTLDPFGFKKFEDVFDQRVARAMQHLAVPTAQAFAELSAEVERLRGIVERLEAQARKR